jgi:hypothetical protein
VEVHLIKCDGCGQEIPDGPVGAWYAVTVNQCYGGMVPVKADLCATCWQRICELMSFVGTSS